MLEPPKFSLEQCELIDSFIQEKLKPLGITFFGMTKSYPNNQRFILSNDANYIKLYFHLNSYEIDWLSYDKALKEYGNRLGTWQFCHEDHQCCKIWQQHKAISNVAMYLWMYFPYAEYAIHYVFGISEEEENILGEATDRELTLLLNHPELLRRFIQNFKSQFVTMLQNAEKNKFRVLNINYEVIEKEYENYWGKYFNAIKDYKNRNIPEKIFLSGKYANVYLTREQAIQLYKFYHGSSYKDLAREMEVSVRTIEARFAIIKEKLNAKTKLDLFEIIVKQDILNIIAFSI